MIDYQSPSTMGVLPESGPGASVRPTSFGFTSLRKVKCSVRLKSARLELAVDQHVELVIAGRDVSDVDPLDAAFAQGVQLLEAVDVVRHELAIDLQAHASKRIASPWATATKTATCVPDGYSSFSSSGSALARSRARRI